MKTTMNIPTELLAAAQKACGARTKTETVLLALEELLRKRRVDRLLETAGTYEFTDPAELERERDGR